MISITLNRKQINDLFKMLEHFKEVDQFTINCDHSSGIGPVINVSFDLFNKNSTSVDITDVERW
jgi:hypothetical protein